MLKREWGAESNWKLPHLFIPSKPTNLVPSLRWKTCHYAKLQAYIEGPTLGQNTLMMMMM